MCVCVCVRVCVCARVGVCMVQNSASFIVIHVQVCVHCKIYSHAFIDVLTGCLPSDDLLHNIGTSPFLMGQPTVNAHLQ